MKPGDTLLLYTDGVSEAPNAAREWFGKRRIEEYLNLHAGAPAEQTVLDLFTALRFFSPGTAQADDITVMVLRYLG
jgi:sigma-B regulation protein RsbU (phosphoserine phosphatase)